MVAIVKGGPYHSALLTIPRFNVEVRAISVGRVVWFPVRTVCRVLGVNHQTQKTRLKGDSRFSDMLDEFPVDTTKGIRPTLCIRKDAIAAWLILIDPAHCKLTKTRERLQDFQSELLAAADRFLWGVTSAPIDEINSGIVAGSLIRGILHVGDCPICSSALCLAVDNGIIHLVPEEEDEED